MESTALTLAAAVGFLALYPEEQQKLYEEVMRVCPNGEDPVRLSFNRARVPTEN